MSQPFSLSHAAKGSSASPSTPARTAPVLRAAIKAIELRHVDARLGHAYLYSLPILALANMAVFKYLMEHIQTVLLHTVLRRSQTTIFP